MQNAVSGDVVLVAGKGHETVQIIGARAIPFSDRERVLQVAREWTR
jgi:UDP-N-acetylmuramoyl-L-alanyl-D-glutamate--2,6-diaminopimelate ligase